MRNDGTAWERTVQDICDEYERKGIMRVKKVSPPTLVINKRVVHLPNPFPDFVGSFTSYGGRMIALEVKSTMEPRLPLGDRGLTANQQDALHQWHAAGAIAYVLWIHDAKMAAIPWSWINNGSHAKSIAWSDASMFCVKQGIGRIIWDFELVIRKYL